MPARFYEQEVSARLGRRRHLAAFLDSLIRQRRPQLKTIRLTYIFCDDARLLEINRQFLDHDTFTDIITFDLSTAPEVLEGEIYISTERVAENAARFRVPYQHELHRVVFHGALHLCGLKDKTKAQRQEMRTAEEECLKAYFKDSDTL